MGKPLSLSIIVILAVSSLIMINPTQGQVGVTTPSIPSFGVMYEPHTYYVSPTYGVDPSTGKAVMTHEGYYEEYKEVWVSISNQPFKPYNDSRGNFIELFYDVRWKGHDSNTWESIPDNIRFTQKTDFDLTGIVLGFRGYEGSEGYMALLDYVPGGQIDFQVQASIGYYTADNVFVGKTSGWTDMQTLTIPQDDSDSTPYPSPTSTASLSQNPTATPDRSGPQTVAFLGLDWIQVATLALLAIIAVLLIFVVVFLRKRSIKQTKTPPNL